MRAYITVILDSFYEAFASRVLYIVLLVMTIVLAGLVPLSYNEQRMLQFHRRDIREWPVFIKELRQQAALDAASPGKRIVELAGDPLARIVKETSASSELTSDQINEIVNGLNSLLAKSTLHDENAWRGVRLRDATQKLLQQGPGNLSQPDLAYFNRLLLRDAFPVNFGSISDKELYVTYAWWTIPEPLPGGKRLFPQIIKTTLATFMDLFVGSIAIFVAILVTAPIIPRTFEPGAIDLLLSKPISRSLLIIAKYLGGCVFILLSAGYFIAGLWLIVGLRLNVWSDKLLLCVPIFLFQFAIYYAVSMLAGIIWRNAIVAIVVTVLFFLSCFTVGTAKVALEQAYIIPNQLVRIVTTDDGIVCATRSGQFVQWNDDQQSWDEVLQTSDRRSGGPMGPAMAGRMIGPVYHGPSRSLLYVRLSPQGPPRRFMGAGSQFMTAKRSGNWNAEEGPISPAGTAWIFQDADANILLVGATGVFAYEPSKAQQRTKTKVFGFELPLAASDDPFKRIGPQQDIPFSAPYSAAFDPHSNHLLIDNEQSLMLLSPTDQEAGYAVLSSVNHDSDGPTLVGLTSDYAVVVSKSGHIQLRNISSMQEEWSFDPAGNSRPLAVETSADGRFIAVLFHSGLLWLYDDQSHQGKLLDRHTSAVAFNGDSLICANSIRQVRVRDLKADRTIKVYSPKLDTLRWYWQWVIQPIYTGFPKPGELSNLVRLLLIEDSIVTSQDSAIEDLREIRERPNATAAVVHGAMFVLIMLGITCVYVERLDL